MHIFCTARTRIYILFFMAALALTVGALLLNAPAIMSLSLAPPRDPGVLRVASPPPERLATTLSPYGPGYEQELVAGFCELKSCTPVWIVAPSRDEAFKLLLDNKVDVIVGFGGEAPEPDDDTPAITEGSAYAHFRPIRIRGVLSSKSAALESDEISGTGGDDSAAVDQLTPFARIALSPPSDMPYSDALTLSPVGPDLAPTHDTEAPLLFSIAMDLDENDSNDALLLDPASYALWLPLLDGVSTAKALDTLVPHRWFWRDDSHMAAPLGEFWADSEREQSLAVLTERYYGFLPKRPAPGDILDLRDMVQNRLSGYKDMILKAARATGVPPLLLVAVIYRESRFNPEAVSPTGVRGLMQMTQATASLYNIDRTDPEQSILGGAKYLRDLWQQLEPKNLGAWDRWFMALAAYNQGPGSLSGAMRIARRTGGNDDAWLDLKKAYPQLINSRGYEAVAFVESIRYYYYILHGLFALAPSEMQNLGDFFDSSPGSGAISSR